MKDKRKKYSKEFKLETIQLAASSDKSDSPIYYPHLLGCNFHVIMSDLDHIFSLNGSSESLN